MIFLNVFCISIYAIIRMSISWIIVNLTDVTSHSYYAHVNSLLLSLNWIMIILLFCLFFHNWTKNLSLFFCFLWLGRHDETNLYCFSLSQLEKNWMNQFSGYHIGNYFFVTFLITFLVTSLNFESHTHTTHIGFVTWDYNNICTIFLSLENHWEL